MPDNPICEDYFHAILSRFAGREPGATVMVCGLIAGLTAESIVTAVAPIYTSCPFSAQSGRYLVVREQRLSR